MSLIDELNRQQNDIQPGAAPILPPEEAEASAFADSSLYAPSSTVEAAYTQHHAEKASGDLVELPVLGARPAAEHMRKLLVMLGAALVVLVVLSIYAFNRAHASKQQVTAAGEVLLQSEQVTRDAGRALQGDEAAFSSLQGNYKALVDNAKGLSEGNDTSAAVRDSSLRPMVEAIEKGEDSVEKDVATIGKQKSALVSLGKTLTPIHTDVAEIAELSDKLRANLVQQQAPAANAAAVGDMAMRVQRIEKSLREFMTPSGISPDSVFAMGQDLNAFDDYLAGFAGNNAAAGLQPLQGENQQILQQLQKTYQSLRGKLDEVIKNMPGVITARQAQTHIATTLNTVQGPARQLSDGLRNSAGVSWLVYVVMALAALLAMAFAAGLAYVQLAESRRRQQQAEEENAANQSAILRLMNELQNVAEGDLTQEATVTEDITGSIADSVNVTVEELRALVGNVQVSADQVAQTTDDVEGTSNKLLEASTEQLVEIRNTGQAVLDMAGRITRVSSQAQETASVAVKSREAAEQGLHAVQNTIGSMNMLRDQIQETSKRIKRLGESSQEIGEITELISDITEQTNVLALNAAIQAASAGEAGRGFSVVAEEVQRLAERSAEATRQIAALVKAIQTDTHDAVAAMERSTQGVVQGAQLSDNAGQALTEIDRVSRELTELIAQISSTTNQEAQSANGLADNIQQIFAVTEQAGEGTRTTVQQVRELSKVAQALRTSVARFKIS